MGEWVERRLGEIAPLKYGKTLLEENRQTGTYNVYSSAGICGLTDTPIAKKGIIVGRKGTVGSIYYSTLPFYCIDTAFYIDEVSSDCDMKFLYFYMQLMKLANFNNDAAVPGLNRNLVHGLKASIPSLPIQTRIASILSVYDDAIENNNHRIALLEKAAQELYREWFVRFRFPGYKKAKFVNGLPEGWEVKRLQDIGKIETGKTPPTLNHDNYGNETMSIKTPDMHNMIFVINSEEYLSKRGHQTQPKKLLPANSILVSCIGTGGIVSINAEKAHTNQQINAIIPDNYIFREWLFLMCQGLRQTIELFGATGTTMTNLSKGKFERLKVLMPPQPLIKVFHEKTYCLFAEIKSRLLQNQNLACQRDLLLSRLMSGKMGV